MYRLGGAFAEFCGLQVDAPDDPISLNKKENNGSFARSSWSADTLKRLYIISGVYMVFFLKNLLMIIQINSRKS